VNLLLGGWDEHQGPQLYWIDYFGALQKLKYAAHGYAAHLTMGLLDRQYKKDMNLQQGLDLLQKCILEMKTRFVANFPRYTIKIITKDGIKIHQF
jgi:20S proteasome subunit beta 4